MMNGFAVESLRLVHKGFSLLDISFRVKHSLALVGESGSGKSLTLKALMGLLDPEIQVQLEKNADFEWTIGENVAFVPQNPFTALSPLTKIKKQLFMERKEAEILFEQLGLSSDLLDRFPPELSGGQLQRCVMAIALSTQPKVLLLDEPTTALDLASKEVMITLLKQLQKQMGFSMVFVTHDMNVASSICDEICVIRNGRIVEQGNMPEVLNNPKEFYTQTLIDAEFRNRGFRN